jgi:type VI secretion system FHA domain protein
MPLTLLVTSYGGSTRPESDTKRLDREGGTIGRLQSSALVLPDRQQYISKTHARIDFWDGSYYVTHLGKNPTELNGQELEKESAEKLSDGDRLSIGEYELLVKIEPEAGLPQSNPSVPDWQDREAQYDASQRGPLMPVEPGNGQLIVLGVKLGGDPLDASDASFGSSGSAAADAVGTAPDSRGPRSAASRDPASTSASSGARAQRRHYNVLKDEELPLPVPDQPPPFPEKPGIRPSVITDTGSPLTGTDLQRSTPAVSVQSETGIQDPVPEAGLHTIAEDSSVSNADSRAVMLLLEAAGVPQVASKIRDAPSLFGMAGRLLREAVEGLQAVLATRAAIKGALRVELTMLTPTENNPFKAMPNASEVLSYLFASHERTGYLPPLQAVHDAFEDVQAHNAAIVAGMHAALQGVLRRFDPSEVEKRLQGNSLLDNVLPSQRKARMWDLMSQMRDQMCREAEDDFDRTFGATFRHAYNQEVKRLRSEKRERSQKT